jgi:hypothetical protein
VNDLNYMGGDHLPAEQLMVFGVLSTIGSTLFGGVVMTCPPVIGLPWDDSSAATGVFAADSTLLAMQIMLLDAYWTSRGDPAPVVNHPAAKNVSEVVGLLDTSVVQVLVTALNIIAVGFSVPAVAAKSVPPYQFMANLVHCTPGLLPLFRGLPPKGPGYAAFIERCSVVTILTALFGAGSGIMTLVSSAWELADRPTISPGQEPAAQLETEFLYEIGHSGGNKPWNSPLHWELVSGEMPAGLRLDTRKGVIKGTPKKLTPHTTLTLKCTDSYGPPLSSDLTVVKIKVIPKKSAD